MDIDISIDSESFEVNIENPHRFDIDSVVSDIAAFGDKLGVDFNQLDIKTLIPRMIRGVAGCEGGCPADAKSFVRQGFNDFSLDYIEGGILSAVLQQDNGKKVTVKIFPDFD
ncbi:MAG: hypothetical protein ISR96_00060 [Nitrospira sp.]|nr:hypothetical protein [bacterium]MBL7047908.1 hypothetical protein [Nitrospira sp.]